jgi:hypothetical protein
MSNNAIISRISVNANSKYGFGGFSLFCFLEIDASNIFEEISFFIKAAKLDLLLESLTKRIKLPEFYFSAGLPIFTLANYSLVSRLASLFSE